MILVRNVFQVKFGQAREALALWKEGAALGAKLGGGAMARSRILTDVSGVPFYTLVFETEHESLAAYESAARELMANPEWHAWYAKVSPLLAGGHREVLTIAS